MLQVFDEDRESQIVLLEALVVRVLIEAHNASACIQLYMEVHEHVISLVYCARQGSHHYAAILAHRVLGLQGAIDRANDLGLVRADQIIVTGCLVLAALSDGTYDIFDFLQFFLRSKPEQNEIAVVKADRQRMRVILDARQHLVEH